MISIILPVLNEPYLPTLMEQIEGFLDGVPHEVLVQTEKGLGYAVKCGIERSKGDIIICMDADGSHNPKHIIDMTRLLYFVDIVVGSKYVKGGKSKDSLGRIVISRLFCEFAKELFGLGIKDNMSGFIVAKKSMFIQYPISNSGFKFGLELLVKSQKTHLAVEYPIVFEQRKMGKSKANYKEAWRTLVFMFRLKAKF